MRYGFLLLVAGIAGCDPAALAGLGHEREQAEAGLTVEWRFPALVRGSSGSSVLPSYLAHLFGKDLGPSGRLDLACADIRNERGTDAKLRMLVRLPVYAEPGALEVTVPARGQASGCANPVFDFAALDALRAHAPARVEVALESQTGVELGVREIAIAAAPANEVVFLVPGLDAEQSRDLTVVFVTPGEPAVDALQRDAFGRSVFGGFDSNDPYQRATYPRRAVLDAGTSAAEELVLEAGESVEWELLEVDDGSGDIEVELEEVQAGGYRSAQSWRACTQGSRAQLVPGAGRYRLVLRSSDARTVTWSRSNTREDVARDTLQALFDTLDERGTRYSNVGRTYFAGWQRVRRAAEVLSARAANCVDASLLFASVLELIGMEPVIVFATGHAYVGVRAAPGSERVWAIETTGVGTMSAAAAYATAQSRLASDRAGDPAFAITDVKVMRGRGVLLAPR
jgi:hypothetical protein